MKLFVTLCQSISVYYEKKSIQPSEPSLDISCLVSSTPIMTENMQALEKASIEGDIADFTKLIADLLS